MQKLGNYTLEGLIGEGGHGQVFRSVHPILQRPVAIKVLNTATAADRELRERFLREAQLTIGLSHPGIINIYDIGEDHGQLFIVMELLDHGSLDARLAAGSLPQTEALDLLTALADALDYAHQQGIIHRDLKPANVLLRADGSPVVADFGLARETLPTGNPRLTAEGTLLGTPAYMAPEQLQGLPLDVRTDVYAFGVLMFETLTGRLPFEGDARAMVIGHLRQTPPALGQIDPQLPASFDQLVQQMLAKDPDDRPQSMALVAQSLRALHEQQPATGATVRVPLQRVAPRAPRGGYAPPRPAVPPVQARTRRRSIIWGVATAFAVACVVIVLFNVLAEEPERSVNTPRPTPDVSVTPVPLQRLAAPPLNNIQSVQNGQDQFSVGSVRIFQDGTSLRVYGLIRNDGSTPRQYTQIRTILRDAAGKELVSKEEYARIDYLNPQAVAPFAVDFTTDDGLPAQGGEFDATFEVRSDAVSEFTRVPVQNMAVTELQVGRDSSSWQMVGALQNTDQPVESPMVVATFFDADGNVVGIETAYIDDEGVIEPQAITTFSETYISLEVPPTSLFVQSEAFPESPD